MTLQQKIENIEKIVNRILNKTERQVGVQYALLLRNTRRTLQDYYESYADKDGLLHYSDMLKYDRLKKMEKQLDGLVRESMVPIGKSIRAGMRESLTESFFKSTTAIGDEVSRTLITVMKPEIIQQAIQNPVSGLTLNQTLSVRRSDIIIRINQTVTQGLYRGETYKDMSKRLKTVLEKDTEKAMKIIRTEGHRVQEAGKFESMKSAANQGVITKKWWLDSDDKRVRNTHKHMGKKYDRDNPIDFDEDFVNDRTGGRGPHPGALGVAEDDINDRCKMIITVVVDN